MKLRNLFFNDEKKEAETGSYGNLLGLNRPFKFLLTSDHANTDTEFLSIIATAKTLLAQDLQRFGEDLYEIEPMMKNKLMGEIGSMTLIADEDGKVTVKFHKRDEDGLWDGLGKKFPEKETTGKFKHDVFFLLDGDED